MQKKTGSESFPVFFCIVWVILEESIIVTVGTPDNWRSYRDKPTVNIKKY